MGKTPGSDFAPGKYVTEPHPFFLLSTSALPPGSSDSLIAQARESFSCSIARNTQNSYATAVRHLKSAEQDLGRAFSVPMSEEERAYFTCFMIKKGVKKATIEGYLTALRHYELAQGAKMPASNSNLTRHLLTGHKHFQHNPKAALLHKQRRPITGTILGLIGHSIAASVKSEYEQSLLWSVSLCAFWGSFRM